jgi:hypothetical protein
MEFAVALIQLIAVTTRLEAAVPPMLLQAYPNGYPDIPVFLCRTDNVSTKSSANNISSAPPTRMA